MTGFILTVDAPALDLLLAFLFLSPCKFALSIVIVRFVDDIFITITMKHVKNS